MESDKRGHQKSVFPLLVVDGNKDHQLLIAYCLRARFPQAEPIFAATVNEAVTFLGLAFAHKTTFPRMVILDPLLPGLTSGMSLLKELRRRYPQLPVVVLSRDEDPLLVDEAYQLGAHSFLVKPHSLDEWENTFSTFKSYWQDIVTLTRVV